MSFEEEFRERPPGQASGNAYYFTTPERSAAVQAAPSWQVGGDQQILETHGRWNNIDVYLSAPTIWSLAIAHPTVRLWAMVGGAPYLLAEQDLTTLAGPDVTVTPSGFRARVLRARGRVCDGFRVTVELAPTIDATGALAPATVTALLWGTETSEGATVELPATPIPVSVSGGVVTADPAPATSLAPLAGTAPDGSGGVTVAAAITGVATPVQRYVDVSSSPSNAPGTILYVKASAGNLASASLYELRPGDVATISIDDASKLFVLGSAAGVKWLAART